MPYKIEVSPNNRAGCTDTVCKNDNVKITKGEVRFGTWVEIQDNASWKYKHWGCITPKQIENLNKFVEGQLETFLEGFTDLEEEWQTRVRRACEQGHIDDQDWQGDPALNRPAGTLAKEKKKKPLKRKRRDGDGDDDQEEQEEEEEEDHKEAAEESDGDEEEDDRDALKTKKAKGGSSAAGKETTKPTKKATTSKGENGKTKNSSNNSKVTNGRKPKAAKRETDDEADLEPEEKQTKPKKQVKPRKEPKEEPKTKKKAPIPPPVADENVRRSRRGTKRPDYTE